MWFLKTKKGTFWIVEDENKVEEHRYFLGCNDETLGDYQSIKAAVQDVCDQNTGFLDWDASTRVKAPTSIEKWEEGEPDFWLNQS